MAGIALGDGQDMGGRLAGRGLAVAISAAARRRRDQGAVVHPGRDPSCGLVALAAVLAGIDMTRRLSGLVDSVVTSRAALRQPAVAEGGRQPSLRLVTAAAFLRDRDVRGRFHLGVYHPGTVMTIGTRSRRPFEHTFDVAAFASHVGMHAGKLEQSEIVVERCSGARAFGGVDG